MVEYVTDAGVAWKLDLWFIYESTTQFDLEHMKTLPGRLTPETRVAILRIKEAVAAAPPPGEPIRSYRVYEAVLDDGIRTLEEFLRHIGRAGARRESSDTTKTPEGTTGP